MNDVIKVLIVDDSALMRQILATILSSDPDIEIVGTAADPHIAREKIKQANPDVVTLDVEMPKMDGLTFLEKIMTLRPMPVVMISTLTQEGADVTLRALEIGAVDFIGKPTIDMQRGFQAIKDQMIEKVKCAAGAKVSGRARQNADRLGPVPTGPGYSSTERVVAIGASTGGVEAIRAIIERLPADSPAMLITQHMPAKFTGSFARRLNEVASVSVCEARHDQKIVPGHIYIAPGDQHMRLARSGANYLCKLSADPLVSGHRPSVDVLFHSVAKVAGNNAVGVILTGMGGDGADGLLAMRKAGAPTIGQDEASSTVYGMPRVAMEKGGVVLQMGLEKIATGIIQNCYRGGRGAMRI